MVDSYYISSKYASLINLNEFIALKFCVSFCWTIKWISFLCLYIYIYTYIVYIYIYTHISEKAMAPHSSTLARKIPWTEEPAGLQSMGSRGVRHDWATSLSLFTFMHWRRKWQPTPVFLPGESQGQGSLVGCVHGVSQSRTWLKWLSSIHVYPLFFGFPSHLGHYRSLSRVPCAI